MQHSWIDTLVEPTAVAPPVSERRRWGGVVPCLIPAVVSFCVTGYALSLPDALLGVHGYDDGVYFGAVLRFVHGAMPYRDYVFMHPPGILVLLAPVGALGHLISDPYAFGVARCVTAFVAGASCFLAAWLVRHRGPAAALTSGLVLACYPLAVAGTASVLLEPYLVALCLVAAVLAFRLDGLASPRRMVWAGIVLGVAGTVKIWAVFPALALLACCWGRWRSAVRPLLVGLVTSVVVVCAPFALLAPGAFVHEVFVAQIARRAPASTTMGLGGRLLTLTGLPGLTGASYSTLDGELVVLGFLVAVGATYASMARRLTRLDVFAVAAMALSGLAVLVSPEFYQYYAYFPLAFASVVLGICVERWCALAGFGLARLRAGRSSGDGCSDGEAALAATAQGRVGWVAAAVVVICAAAFLPSSLDATRAYVEAGQHDTPTNLVDTYIAPGNCVLTDNPGILIVADRLIASSSSCPTVVDPYGTWLSADPADPPPNPGSDVPGLAAQWQVWLRDAQYVVLSVPRSDFIPWDTELSAWFSSHYRLIAGEPGAYVYIHVDSS